MTERDLRRRGAVAIPLIGLIAALVAISILSGPSRWLYQIRNEPDIFWFGIVLDGLNIAPAVTLAILLYRSRPSGWLWRTALIAAVITTLGELWISYILLTGDDPQTPVLLVFYVPTQIAAMLVIGVLGFLISLFGRTKAMVPADDDHAGQTKPR